MIKEYSLVVPENYKTGNPVNLKGSFEKIDGYIQFKNIIVANSTIQQNEYVFIKVDEAPWPKKIKLNSSLIVSVTDNSLSSNVGLGEIEVYFYPHKTSVANNYSVYIGLLFFITFLAIFLFQKKNILFEYINNKKLINDVRKLLYLNRKMEIYSLVNSSIFSRFDSGPLNDFKVYYNENCFKYINEKEFQGNCRRLIDKC